MATYTASDSGGDEVHVKISLGTPTLASAAGVTAIQDCSDRVSSMSRSVVIPVEYDVTIDSAMAGELYLFYSGTSGTVQDNQFNESATEFWAASYDNAGDVCANPKDYDSPVGDVVWHDAQPRADEHFTGYLVADDVLTPDDPSPKSYGDTVMFRPPQIRIGDRNVSITSTSGDNVVTCGASGTDPAADSKFDYVALDPETAVATGCYQ